MCYQTEMLQGAEACHFRANEAKDNEATSVVLLTQLAATSAAAAVHARRVRGMVRVCCESPTCPRLQKNLQSAGLLGSSTLTR